MYPPVSTLFMLPAAPFGRLLSFCLHSSLISSLLNTTSLVYTRTYYPWLKKFIIELKRSFLIFCHVTFTSAFLELVIQSSRYALVFSFSTSKFQWFLHIFPGKFSRPRPKLKAIIIWSLLLKDTWQCALSAWFSRLVATKSRIDGCWTDRTFVPSRRHRVETLYSIQRAAPAALIPSMDE